MIPVTPSSRSASPPFEPPSPVAVARRRGVEVADVRAHTVVLVEGESDGAAVRAAATLTGLDLDRLDVAVVAMGGVTNIRHHLRRLGSPRQHTILGLYDSAEAAVVGRALADSSENSPATHLRLHSGEPNLLALHGFQVCHRDLEDELIRAVGTDDVIGIIADAGELRAWHSMQQQPAQRGRPVADQLRRWFGSGATRKIRYAPLLVAALPPERLPPPLARLLDSLVSS